MHEKGRRVYDFSVLATYFVHFLLVFILRLGLYDLYLIVYFTL